MAACTPSSNMGTVLPPADAEAGRWVVLDGANNTRDIGGYGTVNGTSVRWGTVYRSGSLPRLTDTGCQAFVDLGVRRVVDFRNRLAPSPLFDGDAICVFQASKMSLLPIRGSSGDLTTSAYVQTVVDNAESYRRTFELLADPANLPLLYHCAAGKDRSGIMTALLLTLLGVDRPTVIDDYALSSLVGASVDPQAIADVLDEVDRQGGIADYLGAIGVSAEVQAAIQDNLLE